MSFLDEIGIPENFRFDEGSGFLLWDLPTLDKYAKVYGYLLFWRKRGENRWRKVRNGGAVPVHRQYFKPTANLEYMVSAETQFGVGPASRTVFVAG